MIGLRKLIACPLLLLLCAPSAGSEANPSQPYEFRVYETATEAGIRWRWVELSESQDRVTPLIVFAGGSEGGFWLGDVALDFMRAGYSVAGLAYFGAEGTPEKLVERPLEPIGAALEAAREGGGATRRCMGLIGASKGGELTLLLAAYGAELASSDKPLFDAAVAVAPSHVVWQAPYVTPRIRSAWSLGGEPLAFLRYPWATLHLLDAIFDWPNVTALHQEALKNDLAAEAAAIPVERIAVPTLLQAGENDPVWPAAEMAKAALARAERLNAGHRLILRTYDLDHFVMSDETARRDAIEFLGEHLRRAEAAGTCEGRPSPLR